MLVPAMLDKPLFARGCFPEEMGCRCKGHLGAGGLVGLPGRAGAHGLPGGTQRVLTLPLRLCTLKAMLGDMSRSSDSCSESFFFSLSMALLPLFALCGERPHTHFTSLYLCHLCPLGQSPLPPVLGPRSADGGHRARPSTGCQACSINAS